MEPYTPLASSSETGLAGYEAHEWAVAPPRCDAIVAPRARPCSAQSASVPDGPLDGGLPPEVLVVFPWLAASMIVSGGGRRI